MAAATATDAPNEPTDTVHLRWLGAAGFQLRWRDAEAVIDPYLSRPEGAAFPAPFTAAELSQTTLLLVSHGHFDHSFDAPAVAAAARGEIYAPSVVCRRLARAGVAKTRLHPNERAASFVWAGGLVTILRSRHVRFDAALVLDTLRLVWRGRVARQLLPLLLRYPAGSNSDFLLELGSHRLLFSGSGGGDYAELARVKPTCYLLPFAGRSDTCDYYLRALRELRPARVVLHHFDVFYPSFAIAYPVDDFRRRLARELPDIELTVPEPGQWFALSPQSPAKAAALC